MSSLQRYDAACTGYFCGECPRLTTHKYSRLGAESESGSGLTCPTWLEPLRFSVVVAVWERSGVLRGFGVNMRATFTAF